MSDLRSISLFDRSASLRLLNAPSEEKIKITGGIWAFPSTALSIDEAAISTAFFKLLQNEIAMVQHHERLFASCTLDNVRDVIGLVRTMLTQPLMDVLSQMRQSLFINTDDASRQRILELSVRLWLTVNVNSRAVAVGGTYHREQALDWATGISIADVLEKVFDQSTAPRRTSKVDGRFSAEYLVNNCGLGLEWTDYLTDHLRLDANRQVLLVYKHKVYLNACVLDGAESPIPLAVVSEALDTLNLLFPFGDPSTKQLLARHNDRAFYALGTCGRERKLDLSHFTHWRQELDVLLEIYNSPPRTWKQLAVDRRNKLEWSAFWVTVMVAFLTLVSIPCSIIQAVCSVKSYHLALAQNNNAGRNEL